MTINLIEQCLEQESLEILPTELQIAIPVDTMLIVVDPCAINIKDLMNILPGSIPIVRIRRPVWGKGNVWLSVAFHPHLGSLC